MKKLLTPILLLLLIYGFRGIDDRSISGIVKDGSSSVLPGVVVRTDVSKHKATTDLNGHYTIIVSKEDTQLEFLYIGFKAQKIKIDKQNKINVILMEDSQVLNEVVVTGSGAQYKKEVSLAQSYVNAPLAGKVAGVMIRGVSSGRYAPQSNSETYAAITENAFHHSTQEPLSTFSIDVDAAAYSNVRRFINGGDLPPEDAVRIEEMVNYFNYDYAQPKGNDPVNIITEVGPAPWNPKHKLVQIGLQGRTVSTENLPASNLVFLIDVSGSMSDANKLPLLVSSFKLLTDQLRAQDKVAIVVYAGNSGLVLPSTSGHDKAKIKEALNALRAGGSTAGGQGIKLAYKIATENFVKGGNNRVILATDGDFNVGASSDSEMQHLIEEERTRGIFLTVLGYGMGNYKDSKMETLADKGNGNYAYIDNLNEARKVLVNEFGGTLFTIAKDVKLQIEFNPARVQSYRLIGYENRMLNKEDFNDDKKDAGELGSGHTVTALYEIIPVGVSDDFTSKVDELKYQKTKVVKWGSVDELMTVKLRYKDPDGNKSKLLSKTISDQNNSLNETGNNFRFAAAVAEFGMILRHSNFKQNATFDQVLSLAQNAKGADQEGYRSEFLGLVKSARLMAKDLLSLKDKLIMNEEN